jgi:hypothetical protein
VTFSVDGHYLLVVESLASSAQVFRREIATGRRELWKELAVADPAGVLHFQPILARDGKSYVAAVWRLQSNLYLVEGLR